MKKLMYVAALTVLAFGFASCEQEEITPATMAEPMETLDPTEDGGPDEDGDRQQVSGG